ncbi:MAG: hypothetical protein ABL927_03870, partial [Bdellovibrionales bacterium]
MPYYKSDLYAGLRLKRLQHVNVYAGLKSLVVLVCFIISSFASTAIASNLLVLRAYASSFDFNQFVVSANKSADKSSAYKKLF